MSQSDLKTGKINHQDHETGALLEDHEGRFNKSRLMWSVCFQMS